MAQTTKGDPNDLRPDQPDPGCGASESLDEPAAESTEPWLSHDAPLPDQIGRYCMSEYLDEGGQGVVLDL